MKKAVEFTRQVAGTTWMLSGRTDVAYLGWTKQGNIGDEAIYAGQRLAFSGLRVRALPSRWVRASTLPAQFLRRSAIADILLIGGGTLIGRDDWHRRYLEASALLTGSRSVVLGAGVEDPSDSAPTAWTNNGSMREWAASLREFSFVGVRGPKSAQILAKYGVAAEVVGDPALLLYRCAPQWDPVRRISINVAAVDRTRGASSRLAQVSGLCDHLADRGYELILFGTEPRDRNILEELSRGIRHSRTRVVLPGNPLELMALLSTSDCVVSERLHGAVVAAACGAPSVMLSYATKSEDFAASVGNVIPLHDGSSQESLVEIVEGVLADTSSHSSRVIERVIDLTSKFETAVASVKRSCLDTK